MDYELLLFDRTNIIRDTIKKYGEENFYISFSGGKDSTVLHYLVDMAIPDNKIPRVFINTGIEYNDIVAFVKSFAEKDNRFIIIAPSRNVKQTLEQYGYPFKSKEHSLKVGKYQDGSRAVSILKYKNRDYGGNSRFQCPKILQYQYEDSFKIKLSDKCCYKLKKEPIHKWEKENKRSIAMTGMRKDEGGQRAYIAVCITTRGSKVVKFHPLLVVSEQWENEFIAKNNIQLCKLYYSPYNFTRTGCKGCPFALELDKQLEVMERLLPAELKQCEYIWKPIYDEYRKLNYRLKKDRQNKLF